MVGMEKRSLYREIWRELSRGKAMIFLSGPRQSGKTTLARMIGDDFPNRLYFNWDILANKRQLVVNPTFFTEMNRTDSSKPLVIFDEIHKYRRWKNYLKGVYDQFSNDYHFLVLGSGRLDIFQKGGDSLAGRYFPFSLWPFTLAELADRRRLFDEFIASPLDMKAESGDLADIRTRLERCSGFPEPYLAGTDRFYRRWARTYARQLIREDIRDLTGIVTIDTVEILFSLLPSKVGSPLSIEAIARDLQVSFATVKRWLGIFERFYLAFSIGPWTRSISRAIRKERKLYLFDYAAVPSPPARLENMVAVELHRAVKTWTDLGHGDYSLHYIRNKEKEEVDFLIADGNKPILLIEVKTSDDQPSKGLRKFQQGLNVPAVQLVDADGLHRLLPNGEQTILVADACRWLSGLP
ncbi:MAG: hypothetical protein A2Z34_00870 [Planctomycetes bacterium RBG_16_59_8]|nr:MAG: hypothetical protein A2Z34_00870 [Planctomycetes bacterium RBG_16_59_8]